MNKDILIWFSILFVAVMAGEKDGEFKSVIRWATLIIVLGEMYLYFSL
jgi:hypothetical protein